MVDHSPKETLREYILHKKLGEGGMGVVYQATNRLSGQAVALKQVHTSYQDDRTEQDDHDTELNRHVTGESVSTRTALAREFQMLASLHHPNIVTVLDYGFDSKQNPFFAMELLESPKTIVEAAEGKDIRETIRLLVQLLHALVYLHRRNILHRDIKPSNVMVVHDQVKLVDFGIAETAGTSQRLAGTLQYMAPEMYLGSPPSIESDLYAVGVVAFELVTHRMPNEAASRTRFLENILGDSSEETLPPGVIDMMSSFGGAVDEAGGGGSTIEDQLAEALDEELRPLAQVVGRLLSRDPDERYHDALDVIRDLAAVTKEPLPAETTATRESFLQAAEFIGREEELAMLSAALTAAEQKNGSVWLITGESGVGKSRLAKEVRINALVRSARVVRSQGVTERTANYSLWNPVIRALCLDTPLDPEQIAILKEIAPDIDTLLECSVKVPTGLPPQVMQARLHAAVANLLEQQQRLVVILLEDLHWAGSESLELLAYLSPLIKKMPVVIMGNYREDEATEELRSLPAARQLRLGRLQEGQIARLCQSMLGTAGSTPELVKYLKRQTEGNVFFLVETVRELAERAGELNLVGHQALPEELLTGGIERIIQRRLMQISPEFNALLNLAAVAGRRLDLSVLERAAGRTDLSGFLMACANATVLEAQQGDWQFSHDKIREWIGRHLDEAETHRLHRQVAEAITAVYGEDPSHSAALGYHWDKANFPEKAYGYYMQAGAAAARIYAIIEARLHYSAALAILDRLADTTETRRRKVDTLFMLLSFSIQTASLPQFPARLDRAAELLAPLLEKEPVDPADAQRITRIHFWKARCRLLMGELDQAIAGCQTAGEFATKYGFQDIYASSCLVIGQCKFAQGYMGQCWPYYLQALKWFEARKPSPDWVRTIGYQGLSLVARGEVQKGLELIQQAVQSAKDPTLVMTTCGYLASAYSTIHNWPVVKELCRKILDLAEANNDLRFGAQATWNTAHVEAWLGNFTESARYRERAHKFFSKDQVIFLQDWLIAADAQSLLMEGELSEAIKAAESAIAVAQRFGSIFGQGLGHRVWAQALAQLAEPDWKAITWHITRSLEFFEQGEAWIEAAHTHAVYGRLLCQQGDFVQATRHYSLAMERYESSGLVPLLSHTRQDLAEAAGG